jgi:uncharacterized membrane protein (UPF0127 family)
VTIDASRGKKVEVRVEIADGLFERARGLMYRKELGEDRGMLFVFPREQPLTFWMKNTRIPLSIAYIDSKGRIADILDMKPLDDKPPHYVSSVPVQYALEVNQGFFEERGVRVGDHAELPRLAAPGPRLDLRRLRFEGSEASGSAGRIFAQHFGDSERIGGDDGGSVELHGPHIGGAVGGVSAVHDKDDGGEA